MLLFIDCFVVGGGNWKMLRNGSKFVSLFLIFLNNKGFSVLLILLLIESVEKDSNDEVDNLDIDSDSLDLNKVSVEVFKRRLNCVKWM